MGRSPVFSLPLYLSRAAFRVVTKATKTVVTFNPPPVDIGAAPITIRINVSIKVGGANVAISATLNPAVLGVTAPRNAFASFPQGKVAQGIVILEKEVESRSGN